MTQPKNEPSMSSGRHDVADITFDAFSVDKPLLLYTRDKRYMALHDDPNRARWNWAYMTKYDDARHMADIRPVIIQRTSGGYTAYVDDTYVSKKKYLCMQSYGWGNKTYCYWATTPDKGDTVMRFNILKGSRGEGWIIRSTEGMDMVETDWFRPYYVHMAKAMEGRTTRGVLEFTFQQLMTKREVLDALYDQCDNVTDHFNPLCLDDELRLVDKEEVKVVYEASGLKAFKGLPESFDCDDFAYVLKGEASKQSYQMLLARALAVGIVVGYNVDGSKSHAANIYIDQSRKVWIYEPQEQKSYGVNHWPDGENGEYDVDFVLF
ncbi:MAG: hypothetical protein F6J92_26600 [Symploca sp. SIO1A3]|nr:hypothetical protein [Symploca sp. SIO1A3]